MVCLSAESLTDKRERAYSALTGMDEVDDSTAEEVLEDELLAIVAISSATEVPGQLINLQLFEAEATGSLLMIEEIIDDERDEGVELEDVSRVIALEDDGDGVGETAVSSSEEMIDVRVELVMTVDCAGGVAICSSAWSRHVTSVTANSRWQTLPPPLARAQAHQRMTSA